MLQTALSQEHLVLLSDNPAEPCPLTTEPAHRITSDSEAIQIAYQLAAEFAEGAKLRDRDRFLPRELVDRFSQSGLWAITVPKEFGGADVSHVTLAECVALIAEADSSLAQLPQNHYNDVDTIRWAGTPGQKEFFFGQALAGKRFGNAFAEASGQPGTAQTKLTRHDNLLVLNGRKFYSTGAIFAHWVQVGAVDDKGQNVLAFVCRDAPGLTVIDDWSAFGQRTTASGTVILDQVIVEPQNVVQSHLAFSTPTTNGPLSQLVHSAIDLGIGRAATTETIQLVRSSSRPWPDSGVDHATDDPFTVVEMGSLMVRQHTAEVLLERSARIVDTAASRPTEQSVAEASIAVAEAKIATTDFALYAANKLFELAGTRSTVSRLGLDRLWRDARTHTLHDPVRWKYPAIGNFYLNDRLPARQGWL